jgi:hypothetical protein
MRYPDPHHRIAAIQEALARKTTPLDSAVRTVVDAVTGSKPNPELEYAWSKYCAPLERTVIEAFLIADTDYQDIHRATGIPLGVLQAYAEYLFDMTVFRDRLERISHVQRQRGYLTVSQQAYLEAALAQGGQFLAWMVNPNAVTVTPKEVLETAMKDGYFMGLTHRGANPGSERAKHAKVYQQTSMAAATSIIRASLGDNEEATHDVAIALLEEQNVDSAETAGALPPHDIIH